MVRRLALGLVVALVVMGLSPHPAAACLCGVSVEEGRATADVAFTGVVAAVEDPFFLDWSVTTGDPLLYTFAVEEVMRGSPEEFTVVRSTRIEGSGSCAIDMAIGERWEIFASWGEGGLWTISCSGSQRLAAGVPAPPVPGSWPPGMLVGLLAVGVAALIGSGWFVARSRRQGPPPAISGSA